jgi:hypothetical protein
MGTPESRLLTILGRPAKMRCVTAVTWQQKRKHMPVLAQNYQVDEQVLRCLPFRLSDPACLERAEAMHQVLVLFNFWWHW